MSVADSLGRLPSSAAGARRHRRNNARGNVLVLLKCGQAGVAVGKAHRHNHDPRPARFLGDVEPQP